MNRNKFWKTCLILVLTVAAAGIIISRSNVLKATEAGDANYGQSQTESAGSTEYVYLSGSETVTLRAEYPDGSFAGIGSSVCLIAETAGFENPTYSWEYDDGSGWTRIEGANEASYTVVISKENYTWQWRVVVEE